jgi:aspartate kinase
MIVQKFGGTSVGSADRIKHVAQLVLDGERKLIVLSAMSGTTNTLISICESLHKKENDKAIIKTKELYAFYKDVISNLYSTEEKKQEVNTIIQSHFDYIISFTQDLFTIHEEKAILAQGELLSTTLFYYYLLECKVEAALIPALDFMRITLNNEPDNDEIKKRIEPIIHQQTEVKYFITQGFICRNSFGEIDNLKRGGSDYTATIIGSIIHATEVQIWTDIDGMHNNDPRIVKNTFPISELSFDEASELAYFGAKILHPTCVVPCMLHNIPVRLKNTLQPHAEGTVITEKTTPVPFKAVAAKDGIVAINIKSGRMLLAFGFLRSVFEVFERYKTPIDMITTSEVAISLTIENTPLLQNIVEDLKSYGSVEVDMEQSIICIVGSFSAEKHGYAKRVFESLNNIPIRMISYGGSKNNISILVDSNLKNQALLALNDGLFSDKNN